MTRSMILAALAVVTLAGCATGIPLYDKAGATREQEFHDRVACLKNQAGMYPGASVKRCMETRGYERVAIDIL
jgi:hypothetical protein